MVGLFSFVLFLGSILFYIFTSQNALFFVDIPTILSIAMFVLAALFGRHGKDCFKDLFKNLEMRPKIFDTIRNMSLFAGILTTVIGYILMLQNLSDPSAIGPATAVSMLGILYGAFIYVFITFCMKRAEP